MHCQIETSRPKISIGEQCALSNLNFWAKKLDRGAVCTVILRFLGKKIGLKSSGLCHIEISGPKIRVGEWCAQSNLNFWAKNEDRGVVCTVKSRFLGKKLGEGSSVHWEIEISRAKN